MRGIVVIMVILREANAKLNLNLYVGEAEAGLHQIKSLMQEVSFSDRLRIDIRRGEEGITVRGDVPEENTLIKAYEIMRKKFRIRAGVNVEVERRIPSGVGLGIGSSQAAELIKAINSVLSLKLSNKEMVERAFLVGSDVPFFIGGGAAIAKGRGEIIKTVSLPFLHFCIFYERKAFIPTKDAYRMLDEERKGRINPPHFKSDDDPSLSIQGAIHNDFIEVANSFYPYIHRMITLIKEEEALAAGMSGKGPALFGVYKSERDARRACHLIRDKSSRWGDFKGVYAHSVI